MWHWVRRAYNILEANWVGMEDSKERNDTSDSGSVGSTKSVRYIPPGFDDRKNEFMLIMAVGMCLSFCAGFINGCSLSGFRGRSDEPRSVAGVTGGYTNAALALMAGDSKGFWTPVGIILSYIGGAFLSGAMIPTFHRKAWELGPEYGPCFLVGTTLYVLASIFADKSPEGGVYYYLTAACNGLQNGMTSMYSSNLIRTTHLTGTTTDIGVILGQLARGHNKLAWKLYVLLLLMMSFVLGSLLSYPVAEALGFNAIIVNTCIFGLAGIGASVFVTLEWRISFREFYLGVDWDWDKVLEGLQIEEESDIEVVLDKIGVRRTGALTLKELGEGLSNLGMKVSYKYLEQLFLSADANCEGTLTENELRAIIDRVRLKSVPSSHSPSGNGYVTGFARISSLDNFFNRGSRNPSPAPVDGSANGNEETGFSTVGTTGICTEVDGSLKQLVVSVEDREES